MVLPLVWPPISPLIIWGTVGCLRALIKDPELTILDLMQYVKGPISLRRNHLGARGIADALKTGKGSITVRAKTEIEVLKGERENIVISEIPYQINKARLVEHIADLVRDKQLEGISDIRDESDRRGIRVVIELKKDTKFTSIAQSII